MFDPERAAQLKRIMQRERAEDQLKQRRRRQNERERTAMTNNDYQQIIKAVPRKAGDVLRQARSKICEVNDNHLYPESGKQLETLRLRDDARSEIEKLGRQLETAAVIAEKQAIAQRNKQRPSLDVHEQAVYQSRFERLVDAGVDLFDVLETFADSPKALRALEDEMPYLSKAASPQDSGAQTAFEGALLEKALQTYGDGFKQAHEHVDAVRRQADMARFALSEAGGAIKSGEQNEVLLPDADGNTFAA
jgi:hypothetical protein